MVQNVDFKFVFDKPDRIYRPGDAVTCRVITFVREKFSAHTFSIRFAGKVNVKWVKAKRHVEETVEYFKHYENFSVLTNADSHLRHMERGTYTYAATYYLPMKLPSSYEHPFGTIRYTVKGRFDPCNIACKTDFTVQCKTYFPAFASAGDPIRDSIEKSFSFGCWWCKFYRSDPLKVINIVPKSVWTPGEWLPYSVQVENFSDVPVKCVKMRIIEEFSFRALRNIPSEKLIERTLFEKYIKTEVPPMQIKLFKESFYLEPYIGFKYFHHCRNITCKYFLSTTVVLKGPRDSIRHKTQFTIGLTRLFSNEQTNDTNNEALPSYRNAITREGNFRAFN